MSAIEQPSVKDTVKSFTSNINTDLNNTVKTFKESVNTQKEQYEATRQELKDSVNEIKNLFKF